MQPSFRSVGYFLYVIKLLILIGLIGCDRSPKDELNPPVLMVAATPVSGLTTTPIVFDCSQTQAGNKQDKLYFRWDWNHDGLWDTEYSGDPVFRHRFYSKGIHFPVVEALNSSGLTDTIHLTMTIGPGYSPPIARFKITPESGNRLTEFIFDATLTKDDEDSLNVLLFRWDWDGDGRWDTGFGSSPVVKRSFNETGSYQPVLEVKDPSGLLTQFQGKLEVNQTNPRLYVHFDWTPVHPLQKEEVVFDAGLSTNPDYPDDPVLYYWKFETGEPLKSGGWLGPYEEPLISRTFNLEIEYLVTLRIVDGMGLENQVTRPVRIYHLNRPPVPRFKISAPLGNLTTQFLLNAWTTRDLEDLPSTLQVRWDFDGDNHWDTEYSLDKILNHRFDSPGVYRIVLEAIDTKGLTDTTSLYVRVTPGTNETGLIIDRRFDGEEYYPTVKIGNQWWMAKNMYFEPGILSDKIDTLRSTCYMEDDPSSLIGRDCWKYGRLYTVYSAASMNLREGAQGICPDGWHLPTRKEWETLITEIGGYSASKELLPGGSTDFNAQYVGWGETVSKVVDGQSETNYKFSGFGSVTYFWSSTPLRGWPVAVSHWNVTLIKGQDEISRGYSGNATFMSVRCVKNE